ncbi:MAG: glycosyltransferase family 2 protein [Candidatus Dojkabacteria bacterium]
MKISLLIVTKNRHASLEECLISISRQELLPNEVVLVENNDHKNLISLVKKYKHLNIKYVLEVKPGISFARNTALSIASGEIFAFIDDDCILTKKWIKTIKDEFLRYEKTAVLVGSTRNFFKNNLIAKTEQKIFQNWLSSYISTNSRQVLNSGIFVDTKNVAFRSLILRKYKMRFDEMTSFKGEDTVFGLLLERKLANNEKIIYSPEMMLFHKNNRILYSFLYKRMLEGKEQYYLKRRFGDFEPKIRNRNKILFNAISFTLLCYLARLFNRFGYYFAVISGSRNSYV